MTTTWETLPTRRPAGRATAGPPRLRFMARTGLAPRGWLSKAAIDHLTREGATHVVLELAAPLIRLRPVPEGADAMRLQADQTLPGSPLLAAGMAVGDEIVLAPDGHGNLVGTLG